MDMICDRTGSSLIPVIFLPRNGERMPAIYSVITTSSSPKQKHDRPCHTLSVEIAPFHSSACINHSSGAVVISVVSNCG